MVIDRRRSRSRKSPPTILGDPGTKPGNSSATLKPMTGSRSTLLPLRVRNETWVLFGRGSVGESNGMVCSMPWGMYGVRVLMSDCLFVSSWDLRC
jgi:hypothetical protein